MGLFKQVREYGNGLERLLYLQNTLPMLKALDDKGKLRVVRADGDTVCMLFHL